MFNSKHFYNSDGPVCSVSFDDRGDVFLEKFYFRNGNILTGVQYYAPLGTLNEVSVETFDSDGKPVQYSSFCIKKPMQEDVDVIMECHAYSYDNGHIISADSISNFYTRSTIMVYDNPVFKDWRKQSIREMMNNPNHMNPYDVCRYDFLYGDSGAPVEYTQSRYAYDTVVTENFKAKKATFSRFAKYGLQWFSK